MTPLIISDESIRQFRALIDRTPNVPAGHGIRIYISGLGSGGPEWSLTTDAFDPALDECCEFDGLKIIVDRELLEAVGGLDVQFENVDEDGGFLITPLAPEVQALYDHGGCCGDCSHCRGGCCGHQCNGCQEQHYDYDEGIGYDDDDE